MANHTLSICRLRALPLVMSVVLFSACSGNKKHSCPAGSQNCPCKSDTSCTSSDLACVSGYCVVRGCPAGDEGCPCYANATCNGTLTCTADICTSGGCIPGTRGCTCDANAACQSSLLCHGGYCQDPAGAALVLSQSEVRACDVLVDVGARSLASVSFTESVRGSFRAEGAKVAIAFTAVADAPLVGPLARILDDTGEVIDLWGTTPERAQCYDRVGNTVPEAGLRFE